MMQAINLGLKNRNEEISRVLKIVRMEDSAKFKFKNCSLGMKQRIGIAMALLGNPTLLVLDEPINGLDADGMRIMREVLTDIVRDGRRTVLISSHILSELEKIATHYGIIRHGKMLCEMTAEELEADCPTFTAIQAKDMRGVRHTLMLRYSDVKEDTEKGCLRIYDAVPSEEIVSYLYQKGVAVTQATVGKIGLEEYYIDLMKGDKR